MLACFIRSGEVIDESLVEFDSQSIPDRASYLSNAHCLVLASGGCAQVFTEFLIDRWIGFDILDGEIGWEVALQMVRNRIRWLRTIILLMPPSLLVYLLVRMALWFDHRWSFRLPEWLAAPGWVLLLAGLGLVAAAEISFLSLGRATGGLDDAPYRVVTGGVFRFSRNPIYIGAMLTLLGLALALHSPSLLSFAVLFVPAMAIYVVKVEEPYLIKRFGPEYAAYQQQTSRWLPLNRLGIWRSAHDDKI